MKHCRKCKTIENLMISSTSVSTNGTKYISHICRECNRQRHNEWYKTHQDKQKQYNLNYQNGK